MREFLHVKVGSTYGERFCMCRGVLCMERASICGVMFYP